MQENGTSLPSKRWLYGYFAFAWSVSLLALLGLMSVISVPDALSDDETANTLLQVVVVAMTGGLAGIVSLGELRMHLDQKSWLNWNAPFGLALAWLFISSGQTMGLMSLVPYALCVSYLAFLAGRIPLRASLIRSLQLGLLFIYIFALAATAPFLPLTLQVALAMALALTLFITLRRELALQGTTAMHVARYAPIPLVIAGLFLVYAYTHVVPGRAVSSIDDLAGVGSEFIYFHTYSTHDQVERFAIQASDGKRHPVPPSAIIAPDGIHYADCLERDGASKTSVEYMLEPASAESTCTVVIGNIESSETVIVQRPSQLFNFALWTGDGKLAVNTSHPVGSDERYYEYSGVEGVTNQPVHHIVSASELRKNEHYELEGSWFGTASTYLKAHASNKIVRLPSTYRVTVWRLKQSPALVFQDVGGNNFLMDMQGNYVQIAKGEIEKF